MKLKIFTLTIAAVMSFASICRAHIFSDNFVSDSSLNTSLWTTQSSLLSALAAGASSPGLSLLTPTLSFGSAGMQMTGVNGLYQLAGIQSRAAFAPPFMLNTTVMGTKSYGNAFVVFLVNSNLSQWVDIHGDLIPETCYQNVWINYTGSGIPLSSLGNRALRKAEPRCFLHNSDFGWNKRKCISCVNDKRGYPCITKRLVCRQGTILHSLGPERGFSVCQRASRCDLAIHQRDAT